MGRLVNKGNVTDFANDFLGVVRSAFPALGPDFERFPLLRRWFKTFPESYGVVSPSGEPTLLIEANFADAIYTYDGNPITLENFYDYDLSSIDMGTDLVADVGLVFDKVIGSSSMNTWEIMLAPDLRAALHAEGGFTVVYDFALSGITESASSKFSTSLQVATNDADQLLMSKNTQAWRNSSTAWVTTLANYDYDAVPPVAENMIANGDFTATQAVGAIGEAIRSYFGGVPASEIESVEASQWPDPEIVGSPDIKLVFMAGAAGGTSGQKQAVAGVLTVTRARIYTPAQAVGWLPA